MVGVAGADYTLAGTKRILDDIKPYDDAVCKLFSAKGTLITKSGNESMDNMIVIKKSIPLTNMRLMIQPRN